MPWKECNIVEERLRFIARLLDGEKMAGLCREFGIARKTGYKIYNRYKDCGLDALNDRSRRPYRQAKKLPFQVERTILGIKKEHPTWGAIKIRERLKTRYPDLLWQTQNQHQHRVRRPNGGHQRGRRPNLAGQLHAL